MWTANILILAIIRNGCQLTSLRKRRPHSFFKVRIGFSCRREQYTSYSDGKDLKKTNMHLRLTIVIKNMVNKHQTNQLTDSSQTFHDNTICTLSSATTLHFLCLNGPNNRHFSIITKPFYSSWTPISPAHFEIILLALNLIFKDTKLINHYNFFSVPRSIHTHVTQKPL